MFSGRPSVRPLSVNVTLFRAPHRRISLLGGEISMNLATSIQHVSGHCWKGFQSKAVEFLGHHSASGLPALKPVKYF